MNDKKILIRLKPVGRFFFGTGAGSGKQDYYLQSAYFPQQTALLGLLRHQLLIQGGLLSGPSSAITDMEKAAGLVGESSFIATAKEPQSFGCIRSLGPCGIYNNKTDELFLPGEPEYTEGSTVKEVSGVYFRPGETNRTLAAVMPGFDHKASYTTRFVGNRGGILYQDDIFKTDESPGISKDYTGKTAENAYYKQNWLRFRSPGFEFAFSALVNTEQGQLEDNLVTFGKERSSFRMTVRDWEHDPAHQNTPGNPSKIVLQSDTMADGAKLQGLAVLSINNIIPFRNYVNHIRQPARDYYNRRTADSNRDNLQLLARGSVLIFNDNESLQSAVQLIEEQQAFRNIGYNQYILY